jgi:hypothetical protein
MNSLVKNVVLSIAVAATTLATLPAANAGDRWRYNRHYHHHRHSGDLAVAGLLGLAAGALVVGLSAQPVYRERVYVTPRPRPYRGSVAIIEHEVVYLDDHAGAMEPWTAEWYAYCSDRYRSFDGRTGTYKGFDGRKHFCIAR